MWCDVMWCNGLVYSCTYPLYVYVCIYIYILHVLTDDWCSLNRYSRSMPQNFPSHENSCFKEQAAEKYIDSLLHRLSRMISVRLHSHLVSCVCVCVPRGVRVSFTIYWFSSREHVNRLSKEHMEAKAEDHIRDIRTDAEIKQMDIEESVPWPQFCQFRPYFSLLKLERFSLQNWPCSRFHKVWLNWGNGILRGTCQGICGGDSCSSLWPEVGWSAWRCVETDLRCRPINWLLMPSRAGPQPKGSLQKGRTFLAKLNHGLENRKAISCSKACL